MLQSSAPTRLVLLLRTRWPSFLVQSTFTPSLFGSLMRTRQGQATKTRAVQTQRTPPLIYRNPNLTLTPQLVELLNASVAINSTTFKDVDSENGATVTGARQKRRCSSSQRILVGQTTRHTRRRRHRSDDSIFERTQVHGVCRATPRWSPPPVYEGCERDSLAEEHAPCDCTSR